MENKEKITSLKNEYRGKIENIRVSKYNVIAESQKSILVKINKKYAFWINKVFVRFSNYTNFLSLGIITDNVYGAKMLNDTNKTLEIDGKTILEYFKKDECEIDESVFDNGDK